MTHNLLETVKNYFSIEAVRQTGVAAVGESEASIEKTLSRIISMVINSLTSLGEQAGGAEVLWSMAREAHEQGVLRPSAGRLIGGGGWQSRGGELMKSLLSDRYASTVETIARGAGSQPATVSNLLGLAAPITLGVLGQQAAENELNATELSQWLQEQWRMVGAIQPDMALPYSLQTPPHDLHTPGPAAPRPSPISFEPRVNGLGHAPDLVGLQNRRSTAVGDYYAPEMAPPSKPSTWASNWLGFGILLVAVAAALGYFLGQDGLTFGSNRPSGGEEQEVAATAPSTPGAAQGRYDEATGNYIYDTGLPTLIKLGDGSRQMVGANSTENRLYQFLINDAAQVDSVNRTKGWISFDRVYFAPSSAMLTPESQQQLRNVAGILKNFPRTKVRIGGYTDNSGSFASNMRMSEDRANAAMAVLVDLGIDATRITIKGYGPKIPIASNDTEDGRALNRRISLRVTRK